MFSIFVFCVVFFVLFVSSPISVFFAQLSLFPGFMLSLLVDFKALMFLREHLLLPVLVLHSLFFLSRVICFSLVLFQRLVS